MFANHSDLIAAAFGFGTPSAEMTIAARGEQGRVWRLETEDGRYAVKELVRLQTEDEARSDVEFQQFMLANSEVLMPRPILTSSGAVLAEFDGHQARAYEWVDLLPADLLADPELVGAAIAAVHRVRHEHGGPVDPWYTDPVGAAGWRDLHERAVAGRAPFADVLEAEIPMLVELESLMEPPRHLQNCHRDLWADNVLPTTDGRICVIDWENCGLEEPAHEVPMALFDFAYRQPDRAAALWGAYVASGGPARLRGRPSFTMVIAQMGHFLEMAINEYVSDSSTDDDRAHALRRVAELCDRPLRIDVIDELLDATNGSTQT